MARSAQLQLDPGFAIGAVDPRLYGSFIEHLGRAVYTGIYQPGHPSADAQGFRQDVLRLVRELGVPIVRYPGGNFVSSFCWEDSVGPVGQRPVRRELAWRTLEPNRVGLQEFEAWCRQAGAQVMLAVNLGTRGVADACNLLEYCNLPAGSKYSDLRVQHGHADPYGIKVWCLGNEMDGPWQVGAKTAQEYGRLAAETAKAMKLLDPHIELVSCGSSNPFMPTFPEWEAETLTHTYPYVDYISLHQYFAKPEGDTPSFLACTLDMERFIRAVLAACDYVKAKKRGQKDIKLSFDEWNVWYHAKAADDTAMRDRPWRLAPPLLEDHYTFEDALVVGLALITLLRHADRIKMACLAQLVNVIAPIMTDPDGPAWRQTIYWPFLHASRYGRGVALSPALRTTRHDTSVYTDVPDVESAAVWDEAGQRLTIFAVNRDLAEDIDLMCDLRGFTGYRLLEHIELCSSDLQAVNGPGAERVRPQAGRSGAVTDGRLTARLRPASWNVLRLGRVQK